IPGSMQISWDLEFSPLHFGDGLVGIVGRIQPLGDEDAVSSRSLSEKLLALRERMARRYRFDNLTSKLPSGRRLAQQARLACRLKVPLLLIGEPGSGKQWIARAIHFQGSARERAFARLDCFHLPVRTFTEMVFSDQGLLRRAEFGTLYLDDPG